MQVLSMRLVEKVGLDDVQRMVNEMLPEGVGIAMVRPAMPKFDATWKVEGKEYRYRLALKDVPGWEKYSWRVDVDPKKVGELLSRALGTRDFGAFHSSSSSRRPRTLDTVEVVELVPGLVDVRLKGDAFGRFQIRHLIGAAVRVARGEGPESEFLRGLSEARPFKNLRAPPEGLVLWELFYPEAFDPFSLEDRRSPRGLPAAPPFSW
jgi:tRNA pseudouridine38-40 synthase